jgi:hypothetical protein
MFKQARFPAAPRDWAMASVLSALMLIVGCASHPPAQAPAATTVPAAETPPASRPLPEVDLTCPLLFEIVAAEVAVQRGEFNAAFATLMKAARETRDPRLARRATEVALGARAAAQALESAQL